MKIVEKLVCKGNMILTAYIIRMPTIQCTAAVHDNYMAALALVVVLGRRSALKANVPIEAVSIYLPTTRLGT
jgi:hypothetical protein